MCDAEVDCGAPTGPLLGVGGKGELGGGVITAEGTCTLAFGAPAGTHRSVLSPGNEGARGYRPSAAAVGTHGSAHLSRQDCSARECRPSGAAGYASCGFETAILPPHVELDSDSKNHC
eukprot:4237845-Pyramimonas_sp.AAC.1